LDILKEFLNSSEQYMWSFEDDIILHSEFHEEFKKIDNLSLNDFDLLYLGSAPHKTDEEIIGFDKKWMYMDSVTWQTHALLWNRRAAEVYVGMVDKLKTIDYFLTWVVPQNLKKQNLPALRQVCFLHSYETSDNNQKMKVISSGKYKCRGLIYQLKDLPSISYSVKI
jgi:GR25 family glycosyltransferase involved in LPS biosynthesis